MRGTKAGVLLSLLLLPALASAAWAGLPPLPNTGINSDCPFPVSVDPICGIQVTLFGSAPLNVYSGPRMPSSWLPAHMVEYPTGVWTITFGNTSTSACISRSDPRWTECGVFRGVHFGFYTTDPIVSYLNPDSNIWSQFGPPCVYFGPHGETVPCTGLSSHAVHGNAAIISIINDTPSASASSSSAIFHAKSGGAGLNIKNVRIAVVQDAVAINNLGPCALKDLAWQNVQLTDSVLPPSTPEGGIGTLNVPIPDNILSQKGWAVMTYDVTDPETGYVLSSSTLDFPLD
jgi:hypothetical protein